MTVRFDRPGLLDAGALLAGLVGACLLRLGWWLASEADPNEVEA